MGFLPKMTGMFPRVVEEKKRWGFKKAAYAIGIIVEKYYRQRIQLLRQISVSTYWLIMII